MLLEYDHFGKLKKNKNTFWFSNHLKIQLIEDVPCNIRFYEKQNYVIFIIGHPIFSNKIDDENLLTSLFDKKFTNLEEIDGSFLVILFNKSDHSLRIINDRFAAFPFYYVNEKNFYASTNLHHLHHFISNDTYNSFDESAVLSFLWFRKVLGNKTFNKKIKFLDYASNLFILGNANISITKYWKIKYNEQPLKGKQLVNKISHSIKDSVIAHMSDKKNFGLFLSGGIDSRAIVAASEKYIECYTSGIKKNNEYRIATKIASVKNYNNNFIQRDLSFYDNKYVRAIKLSPMQIFTESQFLNHEKYIGENCNVMMTGLGLDILLSGLYLNKKQSIFLGKKMLHYNLMNIKGNMVDYYIDNVKYKLKSTSLINLFTSKFQKIFRELLFNQVEEIMKIGIDSGAKDHSLWEFMHIYNMSRHYSFPMMESIRTFAECRSPGISNNIFDISLSMDIKEKVNGQAYHDAIKILSKEIMNVKNANTNLPARYSLPMQSLIKTANHIYSSIGLGNKIISPDWSERSWPKPYLQYKSSFSLIKEINNLSNCNSLQEMGIFNMNKIKKLVEESKYTDHTIILYLLLNLSIFFKKEKNSF